MSMHSQMQNNKLFFSGWWMSLALKNMWRNKTRTLISMASVFFAVILSSFASGLKEGIFDNMVKNMVSFYTGYIQIHARGYWDEQVLENSFESDTTFQLKINTVPSVQSVSPRLESFALVSSDSATKGCMVIGIVPAKEDQVTSLKKKLIRGEMIHLNDNEAMLAEMLAKRLCVTVGDTIVLIGQGYRWSTAAGKYRIKSILHFGSPDLNQQLLYLSLPVSQNLFAAENKITSCVVGIKDPKSMQEVIQQLSAALGEKYEVMSWEDMMPDVKQHIETDTQNMKFVQAILFLLIGFGLFGTQLMLVNERKFEMGMLIAIGMQKSNLMLLMIAENLFTVCMGCFAGIACSIPLLRYFKYHPIRIGGETAKAYEKFGFEAIFPTSDNIHLLTTQAITVLAIGVLISGYPIYKIIRLNPIVAMK